MTIKELLGEHLWTATRCHVMRSRHPAPSVDFLLPTSLAVALNTSAPAIPLHGENTKVGLTLCLCLDTRV